MSSLLSIAQELRQPFVTDDYSLAIDEEFMVELQILDSNAFCPVKKGMSIYPLFFAERNNPLFSEWINYHETELQKIKKDLIKAEIVKLRSLIQSDTLFIRITYNSNIYANRFEFEIINHQLSNSKSAIISLNLENLELNDMWTKNTLFIKLKYHSPVYKIPVDPILLNEIPIEIYFTNLNELTWKKNAVYRFDLAVFSQLASVVLIHFDAAIPRRKDACCPIIGIEGKFVIENDFVR
jgi:hypothetical protein